MIEDNIIETNSSGFEMLVDGFFIDGRINPSPYVSIKNIRFNEKIIFDYDTNKYELRFEGCEFAYDFSILKGKNSNIIFSNCIFEQNIRVGDGNYKDIIFNYSAIKGQLSFDDGNYQTVSLYYLLEGYVEFKNISAQQVEVIGDNSDKKIDLFFNSIVAKKTYINNINLNLLFLSGYISKDSSLYIENVNCVRISLSCIKNEGELRFVNIGNLKATGDKESYWDFYQCNLNNAEFYSVDFKNFPKIYFYQVIINNCIMDNIKWPTRICLGGDNHNLPYREKHREIREYYRQLKFTMSKLSNTIDDQHFHALELNSFYKSLSWKTHPWTKIILGLSWLSSNYGQSVIRPILFLLVLNSLLLWWLFNVERCWCNPVSAAVQSGKFANIFGEFINFSNPVHKFNDSFKGMQITIDALIRIVSSYSIYNFIRASRRFIK